MRRHGLAHLALLLLMTGCGEGADSPSDLDDTDLLPQEVDRILPWLLDGGYLGWEAQSDVQARDQHHGARIFYNDALSRSFDFPRTHDGARASHHCTGR